jgi:hypothetical protein
MKYSAQLEQEAERNRAEVEETLAELRGRLRPGQIVDQLVDYARDGAGAEFYGNLKRQVAENPLPVTVIGAGLAWLALSSNSSHPRRARSGSVEVGAMRERAYGTVRDAERRAAALGDGISGSVESAAGNISDMARTAADTARTGAARLRGTATSVGDRLSSAYVGATDAASRATHAAAQSVTSAGHSLADRSRNFADFCREQPLVLAGIGVALGAALGAVLPSTETEDRLMGDAADKTKERVQGAIGDQVENVQSVGEDAADRAIAGAQDAIGDRDTAENAQSGGHEEHPDAGLAEGDNVDIEWPTRDGSSRAADTSVPLGERPSNG